MCVHIRCTKTVSSSRSTIKKGHYATGKALEEAGVVSSNDMTLEAISCKIAYLMGRQDLDKEEIANLMCVSMRGEGRCSLYFIKCIFLCYFLLFLITSIFCSLFITQHYGTIYSDTYWCITSTSIFNSIPTCIKEGSLFLLGLGGMKLRYQYKRMWVGDVHIIKEVSSK